MGQAITLLVNDAAELQALYDSTITDYTRARVISYMDDFDLVKSSTAALVPDKVLRTASGRGRWIRQGANSPPSRLEGVSYNGAAPFQAMNGQMVHVSLNGPQASVTVNPPVSPTEGMRFGVRVAAPYQGARVLLPGISLNVGRYLFLHNQSFVFTYHAGSWVLESETIGQPNPGVIIDQRSVFGTSSIGSSGMTSGLPNGTPAFRIPLSVATPASSRARLGFVPPPALGAIAGMREPTNSNAHLITTNPLNGGFDLQMAWVWTRMPASGRWFSGLIADMTAPTNVNPSTLINCVGIAAVDGLPNIQLISNDATGLSDLVDTGIPARTEGTIYYLRMSAFPGETLVSLQFDTINPTHTSAKFDVITNLPMSIPLGRKVWGSANLDTTIEMDFMYFRTLLHP